MGRWSVDSEKMYNNEYWSNRYIVEAATLSEALDIARQIRFIEKNCTNQAATLTKFRVSTTAVGDDVYQIENDNVAGSLVAGSDLMPLFNRVRIDFNTNGGGRPSRKYWCGPMSEADQVNGFLVSAMITFYNTNFVNPLLAVDGFVDVDGQTFSSGSVMPKVAMRQLRRGSKRKALPIIP